MPFGLGFFATASAGAGAAGSYDLLESQVLTGSQTAITFSNLTTNYASTYQHLQVRFTARSSRASTRSDLTYQINGVSTSSYAVHFLLGNGSNVSSASATSYFGYITENLPAANAGANIFCSGVIDLLDPFETTKNKVIRTSVGTDVSIQLVSGLLQDTTSTTSFALVDRLGQLVSGTRVSLYGIKAA